MTEDRKLPPAFRERIAEHRRKHAELKSRDQPEIEDKAEEKIEQTEEKPSGMSAETRKKLDELLRKISI